MARLMLFMQAGIAGLLGLLGNIGMLILFSRVIFADVEQLGDFHGLVLFIAFIASSFLTPAVILGLVDKEEGP